MQKSYMVQHAAMGQEADGGDGNSLPRLCVRVEMPHSHADGWAPEEIGAFADEILSAQADEPRGPPLLTQFSVIGASSARHANEQCQFHCVVETAGTENALSEVELVFSRALGYWPDRRYNRQPIPRNDWKRLPSNGERKARVGNILSLHRLLYSGLLHLTRPALTNSLPLLLWCRRCKIRNHRHSPCACRGILCGVPHHDR